MAIKSSFYSSNKSADIGFTWKRERVYVSQTAANRKFTPNGSVDGFYVTRY